MERDIKKQFNLQIYENSKGGYSLSQDNKYQFYLHYTYNNGVRLWKCKEYKNPTTKERCSAFFKDKGFDFFQYEFQAGHSEHKYYSIEIQRDKYRQYFKETIMKSINKYTIKPKDIYDQTKLEHPNLKLSYNKCKQTICNYIESERTPESNSLNEIDSNNDIFKEDDGTPLIKRFDPTKGLLIMSITQARLLAQYQEMIFFDGTFKVTPNLFYQLCLYQMYIHQYKTTILGEQILLTDKRREHYEFAFNSIKAIVTNYTIGNLPYEPKKFMIDKEDAIIIAIKSIWPNIQIKLCYFHFGQNILRRVNNNYFKSLLKNNYWPNIIVFGAKALALIPPEDAIPIREDLKAKSKKINDNFLNEYVQYFEKEWILGCEINDWNFYNDFINRTNNFSESFNHKINNLVNNKKAKIQSSVYNYKILIKESLDKYHELVENNGAEEIIIDPFDSKAKKVCEKFALDYQNLKSQLNFNAEDNIYSMDIDI